MFVPSAIGAPAECGGDRCGDVHQLGLAQGTAMRRIVGEARDLELVRIDHVMSRAEAERRGELDRALDLGARHRGRDRGDRVATLAEHVNRDREQERRVDAAGKADDHLAVPGQGGA